MKFSTPHFWYNKSQRNGVLFLIALIVIVQVTYLLVDFPTRELIHLDSKETIALQHQIDSLKIIELEKRKPKIYPFNPNYITDYKGYKLGMSTQEIDRLLAYRKENKWINSKADFKKVTKVSDSLLNKIAPYFKFPDWVTKKNQSKSYSSKLKTEKFNPKTSSNITKIKISTTDLNKATAEDLKIISGIGEKLSSRIIKYRSKLQGYSLNKQLYEVWGLDKEISDKVLQTFTIQTKPSIQKINVNTATFKQVLKTPYVDYELCKKIFDYRDEVAELQNINELKNIKDFPIEKYDRIILYLEAK